MQPKHTASRFKMAPQLNNGSKSQGQNNGGSSSPATTNGNNSHRNVLGKGSGPLSPIQTNAFQLNPKDHDIKVVIRNGRIVAGEDTLPFKRNKFGIKYKIIFTFIFMTLN
jgi:hypothetical protein